MKWPSVIFLLTLLFIQADAHVPLTPAAENDLNSATPIQDPEKSYAIYGEIHEPGEADYYRMNLSANQRLEIQLSVPDPAFMPALVVMGPGIEAKDALPEGIKAPEGAGVLVLQGKMPERAGYEPFSPMSLYQVSSYTRHSVRPGSYYIAVYSQDNAGPYTLATGWIEEFSSYEWVTVPIDLVSIRLWQGQALPLIFGPMAGVVAAGLLILRSRGKKHLRSAPGLLAAVSGLTFLGTAATIAVQMAIALKSAPISSEVLPTLIFLAASLALGLAAISASSRRWSALTRTSMFAIGVMGLVFWSGLIIGPLLAFAASAVPEKMSMQSTDRR